MEASCNDDLIDFHYNVAAVTHFSPTMSFNGTRLVVDEMDFLVEKKGSAVDDDDQMVQPMELHVDTSLDLLTKSSTSNIRSTIEEGSLEARENKGSKLAMLAELHHMSAENQRLRELVDQVNDKYNTLHKHLMKLKEKQHNNKIKGAIEEKGEKDDTITRAFLDTGVAMTEETWQLLRKRLANFKPKAKQERKNTKNLTRFSQLCLLPRTLPNIFH
ncbi:uncharacterized protein LOC114916681 [Cajanus cajan]|uniref:uncharacterized protein LOC114916681 n=1 Tax=Cajanus cajan TaxID=3821 RepID=UPI0010FBA914|nr:uncharacterized protein LOC114916681 [Cajanus cajan]